MLKITKNILKEIYPPRNPEAHKYDHGLLLIIGGGEFYTGSPALAAMAGFRAGVDMVQVLAPKRAADIIASFSPNLASYPFEGKRFDSEDLPTLIAMSESAKAVAADKTAVVVGGGLGRTEETKKMVLSYLRQVQINTVLDADGIHALAGNTSIIQGKNYILTPHSFEFFILTGRETDDLTFEEKIKAVQEEALKLGCVIVLKGRKDIISNGKETAVNETGSPFMTVGGTGDTLAGICGGLVAQGVSPFLAGQGACYINGRAGEAAAEKFGAGMLATDLIEMIPEVIRM